MLSEGAALREFTKFRTSDPLLSCPVLTFVFLLLLFLLLLRSLLFLFLFLWVLLVFSFSFLFLFLLLVMCVNRVFFSRGRMHGRLIRIFLFGCGSRRVAQASEKVLKIAEQQAQKTLQRQVWCTFNLFFNSLLVQYSEALGRTSML